MQKSVSADIGGFPPVLYGEYDFELAQDINKRMILHWNYRNLRELPPELLTHGEHILEIYLKRNNLVKLPIEIGRLKNLTNLYLSSNELSTLPPEISELGNLRVLDLSDNKIEALPPEIGSWRTLESLILTHNRLQRLPRELKCLKNLKILELSGNGMREISEEGLGGLDSLEHLGLDGNPIQKLPRGISRLRNLKYISACRANLRYLPSLPFPYLLNRKRRMGNHTPDFAVPWHNDNSFSGDIDFKFLFDNNPKLSYFPFWVIQLLGPDIDCHGCGVTNSPTHGAPTEFPDLFKSKTTNPKPCPVRKSSRTSSSSKISLEFKGRRQTLYFDEDLLNIHDSKRLKEPPTLLELGLRAVYTHELLSPQYNRNRGKREIREELLFKEDSSPRRRSPTFQASKEPQDQIRGPSLNLVGGCASPSGVDNPDFGSSKNYKNTSGFNTNNANQDLLIDIPLPRHLKEILDRGPVTKCMQCMGPQFTSTRIIIFHHQPTIPRNLPELNLQPNLRPLQEDGVVLGCAYFCGDNCLSSFRTSQSRSNLWYGSPQFILGKEIPWCVNE